MAKQKKDPKKQPNVHDELKGFNIKINEFGEIITNLEIDQLNAFLDEKVEDKKLKERQDSSEEE